MQKTLDEKIARIIADPSCKDFILADAKDADMAYGLAAPVLRLNPMTTNRRLKVSRTTAQTSAPSSSKGSSISCL